jgi:hypothetical protein
MMTCVSSSSSTGIFEPHTLQNARMFPGDDDRQYELMYRPAAVFNLLPLSMY